MTPTPAAIAPTPQTVTIVQSASGASSLSNLATTIVSTPVAVVTTANTLQAVSDWSISNYDFSNINRFRSYPLTSMLRPQVAEKSLIQHHHTQSLAQQQVIGQHQINANNSTTVVVSGKRQSTSSNNSNLAQASKNDSNSIIQPASTASSTDEAEEINTKELAQRISAELKRYSIPQAIFAQRVLCRSQGTLSDLLRNPKPWSKLKSGRETFRRMYKWLEEPEFQRMSALRLAGKIELIKKVVIIFKTNAPSLY